MERDFILYLGKMVVKHQGKCVSFEQYLSSYKGRIMEKMRGKTITVIVQNEEMERRVK